MATGKDKIANRRMRGSYVTTVVGIALVLFMLGSLGLIMLNAQKLSDHVRENIRFQIYLKDDAKEVDVAKLKKSIDASAYTKSALLKTKEEAARELQEELGEDFIGFLDGVNPIPATIDLKLEAAYTHTDSIQWIVQKLQANANVKEVAYSPDLIAKVNENMKKISMVLLGFSILLLLIAVALINNTIRLAMYSKRFIIRSMQLVGANRNFIQRPFLWQGVVQGVLAGLIAMGMLVGLLYFLRNEIPEFLQFQDMVIFAKLFGLTVLLGIFIAFISTFFAVNRYIRMKLDDLY
jgi:cell division transport system permease protein